MGKQAGWIAVLTAFAVLYGCTAMPRMGGFDGGSLGDAEISAMAALGRMDEALSGPLFEGDGGRDIRLAVLEPEMRGADAADAWLPVYVQGLLHSAFRKYSAMTLIDRQNLSRILAEQDLTANGRFSERDFISIGSLTNAEYFLTGTVQKLPAGDFSVSLSITGAGSGESRASFIQTGSATDLQDGTLINGAVEALLGQMGVTLTETGRRTLVTGRYMAARAEAGFARGLAAQESGAAVEALLNYSQAVAFDPSQMESLARLGSISQEIGGGSVSMDIINDIQARNAWIAAFKETAAFFNSHPPFEITYDPNLLQIGVTDYANNRADLAMRIRVAPSEAGFMALNALLEGLEKTGRRELWGFAGWPFLDIRPKTPETTLFPGQRSFSFAVQTALVNENGKVISRGNLTLKTGDIVFKAGDKLVKAPEAALGQVVYSKVNAADLTPTLTVVIAGVNNLSGRQISETGYMRIAPEDIGRQLEEQRLAEQRRQVEEQRLAEQRRQVEEQRLAEQRRQVEEQRLAEQRRQVEEQRLAEQRRRLEEQRLAEQRRQVENQRQLDRLNMVLVEGGTFQMGSTNGYNDEKPVHTVTLKSFYMGRTEVTQKEWTAVMGTTVQQQRTMEGWSGSPTKGIGDNYPIYVVSWNEAVEYCNKLSLRDGLTPAYRGSGNNIACDFNASGYRLPTEAEWEYAARGGNKSPTSYEYSGGNSVDSVAWYAGNSGSIPHPVGTKQPNSLGLYDMSGNAWEWCWDWYGSYSGGSQTDPRGASSGTYRVIRGGSWGFGAANVRSANRDNFTPSYRYGSLGFRLVRPQF